MTTRPRKFWTHEEDARLRELYGTMHARQIAAILGREVHSVHNRCFKLRIGEQHGVVRIFHGPAFEAYLRKQHALGLSDEEISAGYSKIVGRHVDRHTVGAWRRRLGLGHNAYSEHQRNRVRIKTRAQLKAAGLSSMGELRRQAWARHARRLGWPEDLRPRAIQILHALYTRGPMTRREIATAIGMPWKGSRKSLVSNDPEGSYLAHLIRRGLVISLHRAGKVTGQGKGRSVNIYTLPLHVHPQPIKEISDVA